MNRPRWVQPYDARHPRLSADARSPWRGAFALGVLAVIVTALAAVAVAWHPTLGL